MSRAFGWTHVGLGAALLLAACSEGAPAWPGAVDVPDDTPAQLARRNATRLPPPTYHHDVAPIFAAHCLGCHDDGGIAPFSLRTYEAAAAQSIAISWVVAHRMMPPWPADSSGACGTFRDVRRLSDEEIAIVTTWSDAGAPEGDPASAPVLEAPPEPAFEPGAILVSPEAYPVMPGEDSYRCFPLDPGLDEERFITAFRVNVDRGDVVHHVQVFAIDDEGQEQNIRWLDHVDPAPGYTCGEEGIGGSTRYVGVWAQGDRTRRWPDGSGIRLTPGRRMVLQIHYHPTEEVVLDRTSVELELAHTVEREGWMRGAAAARFELPPREREVSVSGQSPVTRTDPVMLRGVRLHMHQLGTHGRLEIVRDGAARCVLDIPEWDFEWQLFYFLTDPIPMDDQDELRTTCFYDTTSRREPVPWGIATTDEMCTGTVYVTDR